MSRRLGRDAWLPHSARTAIAATDALAVARLFKLPEGYWAPISAIIVMQSTLGAAWAVSKRRLIGTGLGAAAGGVLASYFRPHTFTFGAAIFGLGVVCALLRLDQPAYRFAGVTLAIVLLVTRGEPPWRIGLYRFGAVALGIAVALAVTALWPPREGAKDSR